MTAQALDWCSPILIKKEMAEGKMKHLKERKWQTKEQQKLWSVSLLLNVINKHLIFVSH
jgi:hypothetical protein